MTSQISNVANINFYYVDLKVL